MGHSQYPFDVVIDEKMSHRIGFLASILSGFL